MGNDPALRAQAEIDISAVGNEAALFAECKWRNDDINVKVLDALAHIAALFPGK